MSDFLDRWLQGDASSPERRKWLGLLGFLGFLGFLHPAYFVFFAFFLFFALG